jgi:hypothetical protein
LTPYNIEFRSCFDFGWNLTHSVSFFISILGDAHDFAHVVDSSLWKRAPHVQDQFVTYPPHGKRVDANPNGNVAASIDEAKTEKEDPWEYSGESLQALQFPLGGFGTCKSDKKESATLTRYCVLTAV